MAVAARIEDVGALLADLGVYGLDPRGLYPAPLVYDTLLQEEEPLAEGVLPPCRVVVDIGHLRTNVCVLQGNESVYARTILRGGASLTSAIVQSYNCEESAAEELKRTFGLGAARPAGWSDAESLETVLVQAMAPLLRDLRQTLASVRARVRTPIESVLLTGGSARLLGLPDYLTQQIGLPVSVWDGGLSADLPRVDDEPTLPTSRETRFALASAVAWAGARGGKRIDLRRGPFVYKASLSICGRRPFTWAPRGRRAPVRHGRHAPCPWPACAANGTSYRLASRARPRSCSASPGSTAGRWRPCSSGASRTRWRPSPRPPPTTCWARSRAACPRGTRSSSTSPSSTSSPRRSSSAARSSRRRRSMSCSRSSTRASVSKRSPRG